MAPHPSPNGKTAFKVRGRHWNAFLVGGDGGWLLWVVIELLMVEMWGHSEMKQDAISKAGL